MASRRPKFRRLAEMRLAARRSRPRSLARVRAGVASIASRAAAPVSPRCPAPRRRPDLGSGRSWSMAFLYWMYFIRPSLQKEAYYQ